MWDSAHPIQTNEEMMVMVRKNCNKWIQAALFGAMLLGAVQLCGCSGDTGSQGPPGAIGPSGSTGGGSTGTGTVAEESCTVCHTTGKVADIAVAHPDPSGADVTLSGISLTNTGGTPVVAFHAATSAGPVTDLTFSDVRFYLADLVPADTATTSWGTWSSPYFERWAAETSSTVGAIFNTTHAATGDYTYTFATGFGSADALAEAPEYDPTHTQRLLIRVSGHSAVTNNTVGFLDFVVPAVGATAVALDSQRLFVTADACKKCHGAPFQQAAHANGYLDTRACVICHSPIGHYGTLMQTDTAYLSAFIHKIHAAIDIPKFAEENRGLGFGAVAYPQSIENCVVCHTNSGLTLGTGDQIDNWKSHPTAEICGSCHVNVNFTTGANHPGGPQTNDYCFVCHPATGHLNPAAGASVTEAHDTAVDAVLNPVPENIPEFDVNLSITPPANGSYYVAGEAPEVHITLTGHGTGIAVDPAVYTAPQDAAGVTGGGLNVAALYVYGPRAKSVPVLATETSTDPNFDSATDTPVQEHDLFVGSSDPQVTTDTTGFNYQLLPIPADMEPGTYMVRVRTGDYGRVGTGNYHIESTALANLKIGTAAVEAKVAGDACIDCHGTGTAPFHDERHAVVFNTDECLACHDQSGNFAIPIANRLHAVHSANSAGDLYNITGGSGRDWSDITFPQNIQMTDGQPRCIGCHTSGDQTYKTFPYMMPCAGCHVGGTGVLDHMRQNGGPF
jgi:Outer membrane cytochrome MtrC/MtrF-like, domains II/IV